MSEHQVRPIDPAAQRRPDLVRPRFGVQLAGAPVALGEGLAYFATATLLAAAIGLRAFPAVLQGSLVNPDTYMRLVRLREMLSQHALVYVVPRDSAGAGTVLHWSHLIDAILLLLAAPFAPVSSGEGALHAAALAFGPLSIGLLAAAVAWAAAPFSDRRWRWLVPLLAVLSPEIVAYALPGEVHHHIPIATTGVLAAGCALRSARTGAAAGRAMGVWAAVGLWLTPEGMPFALAAFGGLGLFWLLHPETREPGRGLRAGGTSLVLAVAAALVIDPPYAGYAAAVFDRLSIVYLVLAAIVCAIGWLLWRLDGWDLRRWLRAAIGGAAAVAGISLWLALFPSLAAGLAGLVGAADAQAFFGAIAEMQPIRSAADAISLVGGGALATLAAAGIAWRARSPLWAYAALCGGLTVLLGLLHRRFATYPEIAILAMLPLILQAVDRASAWRSPPIRAALRLATIALFVLAPALAGMAARRPASAAAAADAARCDPRSLEAPLRRYAGQIVIADPGDAPGLLYWTQLRTVGSLYLRDVAAYLRLRAAWRSMPSDAVPEAVRATGATLVLVCPTSRRSLLVADLPPDTLLDRLDAGNPPPWLQPLGIGAASGYRLYRIVR